MTNIDKELIALKNNYSIIGFDPSLMDVLKTALKVASTDLSVLIQGESGVGKEVVPRLIHDYSLRKKKGGKYIEFWLKPAVVALGVPLYLQFEAIKKQALPILLSQLVGCLVGIVSVVFVASTLGATKEVIISLAPKSVTTPIAMEITAQMGGIPSLTAAVVVITGILGAMLGYKILQLGFVKNPVAQGISMGTAAHAVGTSASLEISARYGAFSSLGLILNGILTSILTPYVLSWMGYI